jgi:ankyrin repeat protein
VKRSAIFSGFFVVCLPLVTGLLLAAEQAMPTMTLRQAVSGGDIEQLKLHIARGADLNKADKSNMTTLVQAILASRVEVVKVLVEAGANVDQASVLGPPLAVAAGRAKLEIAGVLVDGGADVNAKDRSGKTALISAAEMGQQELVELLVAKGADVNVTDKQGRTALTVARRFPDVADFLREKGATEPVNAYGEGPYGRRSMEGGMGQGGGEGYRAMQEEPDVLADPNALRAKIAGIAGLAESIEAVDANAASEERSWASRRSDNRAGLIRSVGKQFAEELVFIRTLAVGEKAEKTVAAVDALAAKRTERYKVIGAELREVRRLALQEERETTGRGGGRGRSGTRSTRGRGMQNAGQGYGEAGDMGYGGPYGNAAPGRPGGRGRRPEDVEEPPLDPDTEMQLQAWLGANPEDKRSLLASVHEMDLFELDGLRAAAVEEEATKTTAAIEGLMLARQTRVARITVKMAEEDARLERMAERTGATRGRRGRGTLQGQQPQGQVPTTSRRGRRGR